MQWRILTVTVAMALAVALPTGLAGAKDKPATDAAKPAAEAKSEKKENGKGKKWDAKAFYSANCASCHGEKGGGAFGPDLSDVEEKGDKFFSMRIKEGSPKGMPAFGDKLSKEELDALIMYVKSL